MIETDRLILRPISREDIPAITRICQDPTIAENTLLIPYPYSEADAARWLDSIEAARSAGSSAVDLAILERISGDFIGVISLSARNRHDDTEAGYWLDRNWRGRGFMTEALRAVIALAFRQGAHRVFARHFSFNPASGRVMVKAGMAFEGILRESLKKNGRYLDDVSYGILDREFAPEGSPGSAPDAD